MMDNPVSRWENFVAPEPAGWQDDALCLKFNDPENWFPEPGPAGVEQTLAAKAICQNCPVKDECLAAALAAEINADGTPAPRSLRHGIYGGMSPTERYRHATGTEPKPKKPRKTTSPTRARKTPGARRPRPACGTEQGYAWHRYNEPDKWPLPADDPCGCKAAHRERAAADYERRRRREKEAKQRKDGAA